MTLLYLWKHINSTISLLAFLEPVEFDSLHSLSSTPNGQETNKMKNEAQNINVGMSPVCPQTEKGIREQDTCQVLSLV